ncbi:MAG: histidinol-phosphate transaminase [Candidatus Nitrosocaldaceae archaeon]
MDIRRLAKNGYLTSTKRAHGGSKENNILDFSASVNPFGCSRSVYKVIRENLHLINRYPDPSYKSLKDAISNYLSVNPSSIIIGNGANEIIHSFTNIFINEGDRVLIPEPTFYEYEFACSKNSAIIEFIDLDMIYEHELKGIKALFICNPNNPTGSLYSDVKSIVERAYNNNTLIFIDECFNEFLDEPNKYSMIRYVKEFDNLIILRTFTKAFGLAGLRIGYAIANETIASIFENTNVTWNVNALAEIAAKEALNDLEHIERSKRIINKEKRYLIKEIREIGLKPYESYTNFFLVRCDNSIILKKRLLEHDILVRDCSNFTNMSNDHIRISIRKREENIRLLEALRRV